MMINMRAAIIFTLITVCAQHVIVAQETKFDSSHIRHRPEAHTTTIDRVPIGAGPGVTSLDDGLRASDFVRHKQKAHLASHQPRGLPLVMPPNNEAVLSHSFSSRSSSSSSWPASITMDANTKPIESVYSVPKLSNRSLNSLESTDNSSPFEVPNQGSLLPSQLELILRQASGDESVFQPSLAIGPSGHNAYDWNGSSKQGDGQKHGFGSAHRVGEANVATTTNRNEKNLNLGGQQQQQQTATPTFVTTTTKTSPASITPPMSESSNHLEINQIEPVVLNPQQAILGHHKAHQSNASASFEFNNQVIYEGPATPPSAASSDDYYFSSSERSLNNKELLANEHNEAPHSNAWWALGLDDELERVNNLSRADYLDYCDKSPLLINNKQRSLCRVHPRVMSVVGRGLKMAIDECQARFATSRWNCSLIIHSSAPLVSPNEAGGDQRTPSVFGDIMRRPNRERSFLNAIIAAGLAHSMTKACSQGELPEECSCDRKIKSKNNKGRIEWVACSDDIDYGARFSRDFTDNFDLGESDATSTIYMHNSEVGRRVFKSATDITCTCSNSENGMCQTKRCWKHLGSYADVVEELIKRYEGATHVQRSNKDPHKLRPARRGVRKPKRKDLVYIEESPDYCQQNTRFGVLGTQNRLCNSTSHGPDSCSLLCCGRGFQSVVEQIEEDCNCKFVWCCQVKCNKCKRFVNNDVCN